MTYDQMSDNDLLSYTNSLVTIMVVINHRNIQLERNRETVVVYK